MPKLPHVIRVPGDEILRAGTKPTLGHDRKESDEQPGLHEPGYEDLSEQVRRCKNLAKAINEQSVRVNNLLEDLAEIRENIKEARRLLAQDQSDLLGAAAGKPKLF